MSFAGVQAVAQAVDPSSQIHLCTFNIRYANPNDKGNLWADRQFFVADLFQKRDFDIVGTQEALIGQLNDLEAMLPEYRWIGESRTGDISGEHCAIFYKEDRFDLLGSGTFWLSEAPDTISKGWDAALPRICTWAHFSDKSSKEQFYVFNVHFDHVGQVARRESLRLLNEKAQEIAGTQLTLLIGDFNFDEDHANYLDFLADGTFEDAYDLASRRINEHYGTFNAFNPEVVPQGRIDHIFLTNAERINISTHHIVTDHYQKKLPSDHYPVAIRFSHTFE